MGTYEVHSMGGRLLVRTGSGDAAYRMAHRIADERGVYVELRHPDGWINYVYPAAVAV